MVEALTVKVQARTRLALCAPRVIGFLAPILPSSTIVRLVNAALRLVSVRVVPS